VPLFSKQIQNGGPITITHPEMRRFFMDIPSAAQLILRAGMLSSGNEIFILKMPAARIMDLAEVMRALLAPKYGFNPDEIPLEIVGMRKGEKIDEELLIQDETSSAYESDDMYLVIPNHLPYQVDNLCNKQVPLGFRPATRNSYSSKDAQLLTKKDIAALLSDLGLLE